MEKIELITLVPVNEINSCIQFIKSLLVEDRNLEAFWEYFQRTWINKFGAELWNQCTNSTDNVFSGRTNNPLERYNRRLNEHFSTAHPNLTAFAETVRKEFEYYEEKINEIRQNSSGIRYQHPSSQKSPLFREFNEFKNGQK